MVAMMGPLPACTCPHIKLDSEVTEARNWNPDCVEHGAGSTWWNSEAEVMKRQLQGTRLRVLNTLARLSRQKRISPEAAKELLAALDGTRGEDSNGL